MTVSRPMLWLSAAFAAGMYLFAIFGATAAYAVIFCAVIASVVKAMRTRKLAENLVLFSCVICLIVGGCCFSMYDDVTSKKLYPYLGQDVTLTGEVTEEPNVGDTYIIMQLKTQTAATESGKADSVSELISLACFINKKAPDRIPVPKRGDVISVNAVLSLPDDTMNTGGFDYANYLKTQKIFFRATGDTATLTVTGHNKHFISDMIYGVRKKCQTLFDQTFPAQESNVLKAYILGDDSNMDDETTALFSASGLSHVLAVSGTHIVVFLSVITAFLTKFRISKRWQLLLSAVLVLLFVAFTGMSPSAVRAGFVSFVAIFARLLFKRSDPMTAFFEAAVFLCILNPMVILSASFMLSFAATFGILIFGGTLSEKLSFLYKKQKPGTKLRKSMEIACEAIAIGIAAQIFTIPVLISLFQSFSTTSVIATLLLTPLLSPLLAGGLLFCAAGCISTAVAAPIAGFIYILAKCMLVTAELFAAIPLSQVAYGRITPFFALCYAVFVLLLYALWNRKQAVYLVSLYSLVCLAVVFLCHTILAQPITRVSFINVGQGDCALVQAPGNCDILIDAGGKEEDYSVAEDTVYPYLIQKGVYDIEYAVASHGHVDHINGIIGLMDLVRIKNLIVPDGFGATEDASLLLSKAKEKGIPVIFMRHGDTLQFENDLSALAIMPDDKLPALLPPDDENNRSLLLKLAYGNTSFLFTGDLSSTGEGYTVSYYSDLLDADVIKAAHHGSKTANTEQFLDSVSPSYSYIPVGENNYGHPDASVLYRMFERNITYYRADKQKDVTFYLDKVRIRGIQYHGSDALGG